MRFPTHPAAAGAKCLTASSGIQYFEVPLGEGRKLLFVRIGQDEPLFDKQTLRVLPAS